jgi:hypothetical protein
MAISRMQQPRQMYGLGSFVKKAVGKVTKPFTKVAKKIVPREVAGIMRAAAPFLPAGYREAAYLLGTAKQTGRISPIDLALVAAPRIGQMKLGGNQTIAQRLGGIDLPFTERSLGEVLVGSPAEYESRIGSVTENVMSGEGADRFLDTQKTFFRDPKLTKEATSGIFGEGGKMFQFGKPGGPGILDTKAGQTLFGKEKDGQFQFSPLKLGSIGVSALSLIQNSKTPDEAGTALAAATGDSADYDRGYALFSQLTPELFAVPERFRMDAKGGGLMRTNYAQGSEYIRKRPNFFKDLFLEREGGGGKDYMLPMEASERKDLNEVFIFANDDMAKAKELEAEKIFPVLQDKTMQILDVVLDMPDSEEKNKILYDINHGILNKQKDSGMAGIANARYETIQKYGYLLDDKKRGLGSMASRKAQQANGGLTRTNYAIGSGDGAPKPVNPFGPKPTGPVLPEEDKPFKPKPLKPLKIASGFESFKDFIESIGDSELLELYSEFLETGDDARMMLRLKKLGYDMRDDIATGGRVGFALGTKPTPEESGLGGLPIEADMRYTGGFMPYGAKEKADDVPARLSKNEFVFTEGAKKMYATMKQLEAKPEAKGMMA